MLAFNHILGGSIIALVVPAPLVPVVAFGAHFVMDVMPHSFGEEPPFSRKLKIQIAVDAVVSLATIPFVLFLVPDKWFIMGVGAFFCVLPDFLWLLWRRGITWLDKILDFAHWIQWGERPYGWIFDAFYALMMGITLYLLSQ